MAITSPVPSIFDKPKSLIMILDSSSGLKYRRFSGWRREEESVRPRSRGASCERRKPQGVPHLQVPVHDAHGVQVVHRVQDLSDQPAGVHLRVEALLHDPVEQLAPGHPAGTHADGGGRSAVKPEDCAASRPRGN